MRFGKRLMGEQEAGKRERGQTDGQENALTTYSWHKDGMEDMRGKHTPDRKEYVLATEVAARERAAWMECYAWVCRKAAVGALPSREEAIAEAEGRYWDGGA